MVSFRVYIVYIGFWFRETQCSKRGVTYTTWCGARTLKKLQNVKMVHRKLTSFHTAPVGNVPFGGWAFSYWLGNSFKHDLIWDMGNDSRSDQTTKVIYWKVKNPTKNIGRLRVSFLPFDGRNPKKMGNAKKWGMCVWKERKNFSALRRRLVFIMVKEKSN